MRIVGILLVRNEDLFVERAVRNAIDFCDEFIAVDNGSDDNTASVLRKLASEYPSKVSFHTAKHPGASHDLIAGFAGTPTWIFGVDGDEIYDPQWLEKMRRRMEAGEFDADWMILGNALNVRRLDNVAKVAEGHQAPPCRSMTKLYNFNAIEAWRGPCEERLHGGEIIFRKGFHAMLRRDLHKATSWEEASFRCLHLCFLKRSSLEHKNAPPRKNIMDRRTWSLSKIVRKLLRRPQVDWKEQRYGRGALVQVSSESFFPK